MRPRSKAWKAFRKRPVNEQIEYISNLKQQGLTDTAIAAQFGSHLSTIGCWRKAVGEPLIQTETKCINCVNACGGCSWSEVDPSTNRIRYEPVKGWTAEIRPPKKQISRSLTHIPDYFVVECPKYKKGR